jgi:hypothetical protein
MILSLWRLRAPCYDPSALPLTRPETTTRSLPGIARQPEEADGVDLALRLTLLTLLLHPVGTGIVRLLSLGLAGGGLSLPRQLRRPGLWMTLTVVTGLRVALDWSLADNHAYLLCYWCFAVSLALTSQDVADCLSSNGRLLIGWAFAFAVVWKLFLSPDYLDGRFFRVIMLTDNRFADFVRLVGGLSPDLLAHLRSFVYGQWPETLAPPQEPARFLRLAQAATGWTVLIEGAVALAFLWPVSRGLSRLRDTFLLCFCVTTYTMVTVEGFGWLLISLGVAQCEPRRKRTRLFYLATFGLILFCREVPWLQLKP